MSEPNLRIPSQSAAFETQHSTRDSGTNQMDISSSSGNVTVARRWGLRGPPHKYTAESSAWLQIECMVSVIDKGPSA